jgi:serine protease inhibitor
MFRFWRHACLAVLVLVLTGGLLVISNVTSTPAVSVPGGNEFAIDLYRRIAAEHEGENIFLSPFSVRSALAMTWEGARGETAEQMAEALKLPEVEGAEVHSGFGSLTRALNAKGKPYEFNVANALWVDQTLPLVEAYVQQITTAYGAGVDHVDFIHKHEAAREKINQWVEGQTQGKIKGLMPEGTVTPGTRLVLANAVYFKGQWAMAFHPARTRDDTFTLVDGTEIQIPMMERKDAKMGILHVGGFSAMELPYVGDELSMVILLPSHKSDLAALELDITAEAINTAIDNLHEKEVDDFRMPKFKITTDSYRLNEPLQSMGMELAFKDQADFTGLSPQGSDLFISDVMHKGFVEVNEAGTEAAAATGLTLEAAEAEMPVVINRPFLFMIRHRPTGEILFFGRVLDPRER